VTLLSRECLLLRLPSGGCIPLWPETVPVHLESDAAGALDPDMLQQAVAAVFHFFTHERRQQSIPVADFSLALEKVLHGFGLALSRGKYFSWPPAEFESDLRQLAQESGSGAELIFFPRLRAELKKQLLQGTPVVRFHGLRGCVQQLAGVRRWSASCQTLRDRIVEHVRACAAADSAGRDCTLIIE
jgi:hypothetical protein